MVIGTAATAIPASASGALTTLLTNVAGAAPVLLSGAVDNGAAPQQQEHVVLSLNLQNTNQLQSLLGGAARAADAGAVHRGVRPECVPRSTP